MLDLQKHNSLLEERYFIINGTDQFILRYFFDEVSGDCIDVYIPLNTEDGNEWIGEIMCLSFPDQEDPEQVEYFNKEVTKWINHNFYNK